MSGRLALESVLKNSRYNRYSSQRAKLQIDLEETKAMKLRNGGKLARDDVLEIGGHELKFANSFTYLGVTLTLMVDRSSHTRYRRQITDSRRL